MSCPARLLLIEGRRELQRRLAPSLADEFEVSPVVVDVTAGRPAVELMRGSAFDAVLADLDAIADLAVAADERISRLARAASGALIVVLSEDAGISVSLAAMRAGAHDCIGKAIDGQCAHPAHRRTGAPPRQDPLPHPRARPQPEAIAASEPATRESPAMRDLVMPMWRQEQRIIEEAIRNSPATSHWPPPRWN